MSPLADLEFDVTNGQINQIIFADSTEIPGTALLGAGTDATVIHAT